MRHFDVNLAKHVQDLYSENCKTQMKEIIADLNKWRDTPCSWIERLSKDVNSLQIAKKVNEIPIKIPARIFCNYGQTYLKMYKKWKRAKITKIIFKTQNKVGEFTYDRALLVKTMLYFQRDRHRDQGSRTKSPETGSQNRVTHF